VSDRRFQPDDFYEVDLSFEVLGGKDFKVGTSVQYYIDGEAKLGNYGGDPDQGYTTVFSRCS
jgi:hypothetical protein